MSMYKKAVFKWVILEIETDRDCERIKSIEFINLSIYENGTEHSMAKEQESNFVPLSCSVSKDTKQVKPDKTLFFQLCL